MRSIGSPSRAIVAALAFGTAGAVACTLLVPLNETQCSADSDCRARGPAFANAICQANVCTGLDAGAIGDGGGDATNLDAGSRDALALDAGADVETGGLSPWYCLNTAPLSSDPDLTVSVQFLVYDPLKGTGDKTGSIDGGVGDLYFVAGTYFPVPGVTVTACPGLSLDCASNLGTTTTDQNGIATLGLNDEFNGYFLMEATDAAPSYPSYPSFLYPGRFVAGEPNEYFAMAPLYVSEATTLSGLNGLPNIYPPSDPAHGHLFVTAFDCFDRHAPNVSFSLGTDGGTAWYLSNGLPSPASATVTQTDEKGTGGFVNIPVRQDVPDAGGFASFQLSAVYMGTSDAGVDGGQPAAGQVLTTETVLIGGGDATFVFLRPRVR